MFVFCASKGVPPIGSQAVDVRMVQFEENAKLIKEYAYMAADCGFKGIFALVSDPVDQLCATVLKESKGMLLPEQIKGYGLGVMNARALYYSKIYGKFSMYPQEGRAFGPHGKDLVIANSIRDYDDELSKELTKYAVEANLEVRKTGFKPYIAPALSSGAISIVYTLEGKYHYSSNYIAGVYMGAKNRNLPSGLDIEKINMPAELFERIKNTYHKLSF
jgi:malate/lactate dehydrogenase